MKKQTPPNNLEQQLAKARQLLKSLCNAQRWHLHMLEENPADEDKIEEAATDLLYSFDQAETFLKKPYVDPSRAAEEQPLRKALQLLLQEIETDPLAIQFFDLRLIEQAKAALTSAGEEAT